MIRHAEGHFKDGSDFDKRMALVSFDNAVELSITTYLQLHPSQRGGKNYERKKVEEWLTNYHKKLEFLLHFTTEQKAPIQVSLDEIVYYHSIRNELYHSGNGTVPDLQCLEGARSAAIWTFGLLFGADAELLLKQAPARSTPKPQLEDRSFSVQTEFLQSFIAFEKALRASLASIGANKQVPARLPAARAWMIFAEQVDELPSPYHDIVDRCISLRNKLIHGEVTDGSPDEFSRLTRKLDQVAEFVSSFPASRDFLDDLRAKIGDLIPDKLHSIRIVQERKRVFLEAISVVETHMVKKTIKRTDLGFIMDDDSYPDDRRLFVANKAADKNADLFLREMAYDEVLDHLPDIFST